MNFTINCKRCYEVNNINTCNLFELANTVYHATDAGETNKMILFLIVDNNKYRLP